ncbi:MAG: DUF86 domain-containing protein [Patescibacteria group bacterium]
MTAPRDYKVYLADILDAIASIERYVTSMTPEQFTADTKTQDAVIRNLEVIGEAAKRIPESVQSVYPGLAWHPAAAMRDFLIHEYPEVDAEAVWNTVVHDLPPFKKGIIEILEKSESHS